jgi:hypothetical protein
MIRPQLLYRANRSHCIAVLFDLSNPEEVEALHRARAVWQEDSDILALDEDHFILIVRPGGVSRLAA